MDHSNFNHWPHRYSLDIIMSYTELDYKVKLDALKQDVAELVVLAINLVHMFEYEMAEFGGLDNCTRETEQLIYEAKVKLGIENTSILDQQNELLKKT